jgi:hypothetical protein
LLIFLDEDLSKLFSLFLDEVSTKHVSVFLDNDSVELFSMFLEGVSNEHVSVFFDDDLVESFSMFLEGVSIESFSVFFCSTLGLSRFSGVSFRGEWLSRCDLVEKIKLV